jgi:hypothetical protein
MPDDAASIHLDRADAEATYRAWVRAAAGREVGLWRNPVSGDFVVVQGTGDWVNGAVSFPNETERWVLLAHYHPELNPLAQYASPGDFGALVWGAGGTDVIRERISSRIDLFDSLTRRTIETHFGYDPHAIAPYFLDVELPGGARIEYSFESLEDLQRHYAGVRADSDIVHAAPMPAFPPGHTPTPLGPRTADARSPVSGARSARLDEPAPLVALSLDSFHPDELLPAPLVEGLARPHPRSFQAGLEDDFLHVLGDPAGVRRRIDALVTDAVLAEIGLGSGRSAAVIDAEIAALRWRVAMQERFASFARAEQAGGGREALRAEAAALREALADGSVPAPVRLGPLDRRSDELLPPELAGRTPVVVRRAVSRLGRLFSAPRAGQPSSIRYLGLSPTGEPLGVHAILNVWDINTGPRPRLEDPHGWEARLGYHRTHLLAHMLGGSRYRENLVTAAASANTYAGGDLRPPNMLEFEWQIRHALEAGQTVEYRVIPIYEGQPMPVAIMMQARGSGPDGIVLDVVVRNATHHR